MTNSLFFCKYEMLNELYQNKELLNSMELTFSEENYSLNSSNNQFDKSCTHNIGLVRNMCYVSRFQ